MKRFFLMLGLMGVAEVATAAGPYDGVYQYGLNPAFYSVHQNGNTLLVASMGFVSVDSDVSFRVASYEVSPPSIGFWDYSTGTINGATARITGTGMFGACVSTTDVTFDEFGGATATVVSYANTALGSAQGVNCAAVFESVVSTIGRTITLRRIF